jgi:MoaA/NifB/PqqE/SkfB family radical SAM enzyme
MSKPSPELLHTLSHLVSTAVTARAAGHGRPFIVGHQITNRCMCRCASCLWRHNDWRDVPLDVLERFYDEASEVGFAATAITGGEPFLRTDLGLIVDHIANRAGLAILLFTTGLYLERRMDEVLPHIDAMIISLDSARPERHDRIRGVPGLYERMMRGVALVKERYPELPIHFNTCVQRGIEGEIDDLIDLAIRLDTPISFDVITERRNGADGGVFTSNDVGLPLATVQQLCRHLLERKQAGAPIVNSDLYFDYFARGRPGYRCHLPKLVMQVDGRGNIEDCLDLSQPIANICDTSLRDIVELPRFRQLRRDAEACSSCNSPTMVDLSHLWERPDLLFRPGGIQFGHQR